MTIFRPFWARRPLKMSSNPEVIKIKVLHFDKTYVECGLGIEIKPHMWPPEPKIGFLAFFPFFMTVLARRPLKMSSNPEVIKIKVVHFDKTYPECGLRIEIKPHMWCPEPKMRFLAFFSF